MAPAILVSYFALAREGGPSTNLFSLIELTPDSVPEKVVDASVKPGQGDLK